MSVLPRQCLVISRHEVGLKASKLVFDFVVLASGVRRS